MGCNMFFSSMEVLLTETQARLLKTISQCLRYLMISPKTILHVARRWTVFYIFICYASKFPLSI